MLLMAQMLRENHLLLTSKLANNFREKNDYFQIFFSKKVHKKVKKVVLV